MEADSTKGTGSMWTRRDILKCGVAGGAALGLFGAMGCSADEKAEETSDQTGAKKTLKIGSTFSLTGSCAADGAEHKNGLNLAIEQWNEAGGVAGHTIENVAYDFGEMEPEKQQTLFRTLVEKDEVDAIIIGYTIYPGVAWDYIDEVGIPYFFMNTTEKESDMHRENPDKYKNIWDFDPTAKWYALTFPTFAQGIEEQLNIQFSDKKLGVLFTSSPLEVEIAELLKNKVAPEAGWEVTMYEETPAAGTTEWGPIISKLHADPPDWLYFASMVVSDVAGFMKQFTADPTPTWIYNHYIASLPDYPKLAGDAGNGLIWSSVVGLLVGTEPCDTMISTYEKRFGVKVGGVGAGCTYDMTNAYLEAVARCGNPKDYDGVIQAVNAPGRFFKGTMGTYQFDLESHNPLSYPAQTHDPAAGMPHIYAQVVDGKNVAVYPDVYAIAKAVTPPWI